MLTPHALKDAPSLIARVASDLNPVACMLTWGALNIIGASPEKRAEIGSFTSS